LPSCLPCCRCPQVPEDKDNINGVQQLSLEATMINQNLSQQLLVKGGDK
jgi:translation initiation factor 3 subunit D